MAVFCLGSILWAQSDANKGQITGTVFDANASVVEGAKVVLKNTLTGLSREVKSGPGGVYRAVLLDPGVYDITASSAGFAESKFEGVVLSVGSTVTIEIRLSVQATSTTIEVGETLLQDAVPVSSQLVNSTAITNLPINGRRFQDFVTLTPNVVIDASRSQIAFAGQRGINSNIMLDGSDYNQPFFGGIRGGERSNAIITVPQSAVQEFQVVSTGYSAEYGRSTGGIMNTITKAGTNEIHGESFYQIRHRALSARNPVVGIRPSETLQQYGGGIGGPIKKNKLFWFAAAEAQYAETPRQVLIPSLNSVTASPANQEAISFLRTQEGPFLQTNKAYGALGKLDYAFNNGDRLTLRFANNRSEEVNAVTTGTAINPITNSAVSNEGIEQDRIYNGQVQYTRIFTPAILNDFRFNGSYEERPRLANSNTPSVTLQNVSTFGARSFLPTVQYDYRWQFADALTWTRGKHTLKFGVDFNYLPTGQTFGFNQFGSFSINGTPATVLVAASGNGTNGSNRFDTTQATYTRQIGNLLAQYNAKQIAFFAQDSFRVNQKLTLDFGVRWEGQINPATEANNTAVLSRVEGVVFPIGNTISPRNISNNLKQFGPRFGIAYTPFTEKYRTVVRAHTGLFYAATPLISFSGPNNNFRVPPGDVSITVGGAGAVKTLYQSFLEAGVDLNKTPLSALPVIPLETVQRAAAIALGGTARDPYIGASFTTVPPNFMNPKSFQAGFGTETEWFKNFVAGVQFNYVNTVHLNRNRDYNLPAPVIADGDQRRLPDYGLTAGRLRPLTTVTNLTVREPSARSLYRSMALSAQYRTKKLQFQAFYTLAYNQSDDDSERDAGGFGYVNSFNLKPEYFYSNNDVRHNFTGNVVYRLPYGFDISAISRARSGLPLNPRAGTDLNRDGNNNDRPYRSAGDPFPRNYFRNLNVYTTDIRLLKNFAIRGERVRIQFSVEAFNLFNTDNVVFAGTTSIFGPGFQANGTTAATAADFMRLRNPDGSYFNQNQQQGSPRQLQGGLRLFF